MGNPKGICLSILKFWALRIFRFSLRPWSTILLDATCFLFICLLWSLGKTFETHSHSLHGGKRGHSVLVNILRYFLYSFLLCPQKYVMIYLYGIAEWCSRILWYERIPSTSVRRQLPWHVWFIELKVFSFLFLPSIFFRLFSPRKTDNKTKFGG